MPLQRKVALFHLISILLTEKYWLQFQASSTVTICDKSYLLQTSNLRGRSLEGALESSRIVSVWIRISRGLRCLSALSFTLFQTKSLSATFMRNMNYSIYHQTRVWKRKDQMDRWAFGTLHPHAEPRRCSRQGKLVFHREMYLHRLSEYQSHIHTLDIRVSASPPDALFTVALNHRVGVSHPRRFCSAGQSKTELQLRCF